MQLLVLKGLHLGNGGVLAGAEGLSEVGLVLGPGVLGLNIVLGLDGLKHQLGRLLVLNSVLVIRILVIL
jgi:hypothetical protein